MLIAITTSRMKTSYTWNCHLQFYMYCYVVLSQSLRATLYPFVCPSVRGIRDCLSRTKGCRNFKLGDNVLRVMWNQQRSFETRGRTLRSTFCQSSDAKCTITRICGQQDLPYMDMSVSMLLHKVSPGKS